MAIYTRWGDEVVLNQYHGKQTVVGYPHPLMLVSGRYVKEDAHVTGYWFAAFLKADGGINEIEETIEHLPEVELDGDKLSSAIRQAT